jgi:hypothetical protein
MKRPHPHLSLNQPSLKAKCASFAASRYAQALVFVRVAEKRFTNRMWLGSNRMVKLLLSLQRMRKQRRWHFPFPEWQRLWKNRRLSLMRLPYLKQG